MHQKDMPNLSQFLVIIWYVGAPVVLQSAKNALNLSKAMALYAFSKANFHNVQRGLSAYRSAEGEKYDDVFPYTVSCWGGGEGRGTLLVLVI